MTKDQIDVLRGHGRLTSPSSLVRKRLAGLDANARVPAAYGVGLYSPQHSARTYDALLAEARDHLAAGRGVILDATFQRRADPAAARTLAAAHNVPFLLVECRCSEDEVRRRLERRQQRGAGPSDADWNVYIEQRRHFDPVGPDESEGHLVLDTAAPLSEANSAVEQVLRRHVEKSQAEPQCQ